MRVPVAMHSVPRAEPIRVLRLTPHFHRDGSLPVAFDPVGGLQIQTWTIAAALDGPGIEQTVATSFIPGSPRRFRLGRSIDVRAVGPRIPGVFAGSLLSFGWFLGVIGLLVRERGSYDLVHIHFNHSVWCRVLAFILGIAGPPVVVSLNTALWGGLQRLLRLEGSPFDVTLWIERLALRRADRVVGLTARATGDAGRILGVGHDRLRTVSDAVHADEFLVRTGAEHRRVFSQRYGVPDSGRTVVYVGRISPEKGWRDLPFLARALAGGNAFLLVCGDGPDRSRLEAALRRQCPEGNWAVTGFLPRQDIRTAMQIADALVLPSRREAFGSVLLEAMASGLPAVAYAVGGIPEVAGDPPAICLVPPGDRDALIRQVLAILDDPVISQRAIIRGHQRVRAFSVARSAVATAALYGEVLQAHDRTVAADTFATT